MLSDGIRRIPGWGRLLSVALAIAVAPSPAHAQAKPLSDSDCLACHGQKDLKSSAGKSVFVDLAKHKASVHSILGCTDCHTDIKAFPHPDHVAQVNCATCHADEAANMAKSIHSALGSGSDACLACHGPAHYTKTAAALVPALCSQCHSDEVKGFLSGVHGQAAKRGDPQAPTCLSCHGPVHKILAAQDPASPVAKQNLPNTCASCHSNAAFLAKHQIPFDHPVGTYESSVHGQALAAGNLNAATCSDCHGSHAIYEARDSRSKINHWNIPKTCGACHTQIAKTYAASIHGQAVAHGSTDAPVCTDCHGEHVILAPSQPNSTVNPARLSTVTCGRCHGNATLDARYNLPADRVPTYADSYHGLAAREGSETVANCASCHGVHDIFPSSDPRSTINPKNLAHTCGACHPGAGSTFAIGRVHVLPASVAEVPAVRLIRGMYLVLIPIAIGFMFIHQLLDFIRKFPRRAIKIISPEEAEYRLNRHFRIAHWLVVVSFPVLVVTGFALKYPEAWWARPFILWHGQFDLRGTVHRVAAVVLIAALIYHIVHLIRDRRARRMMLHMAPQIRDLRDFQDMVSYNLGFTSVRPVLHEFTYVQKIEYLAFIWGTVVMAVSGLTLWFNTFTLRYFPKWVLDAATALHFYEAILATFAILIWHMYTVVFDPDVYPLDRVRLSPAGDAAAGDGGAGDGSASLADASSKVEPAPGAVTSAKPEGGDGCAAGKSGQIDGSQTS
jgi:cytochrome b subunit of formate dehydrogenase